MSVLLFKISIATNDKHHIKNNSIVISLLIISLLGMNQKSKLFSVASYERDSSGREHRYGCIEVLRDRR